MDINKIKAMNDYGKEVTQRYNELFNESKKDKLELLNKSIEKINNTFDNMLDAIEGYVVYVKIKGAEFTLRNIHGNRYAKVEFRHDTILLSKNNTGEASRYSSTGHPEQIFYNHYRTNSNYRCKGAFTDFYLTNREEIEEAIFNEIKKEMDKAVEKKQKRYKHMQHTYQECKNL